MSSSAPPRYRCAHPHARPTRGGTRRMRCGYSLAGTMPSRPRRRGQHRRTAHQQRTGHHGCSVYSAHYSGTRCARACPPCPAARLSAPAAPRVGRSPPPPPPHVCVRRHALRARSTHAPPSPAGSPTRARSRCGKMLHRQHCVGAADPSRTAMRVPEVDGGVTCAPEGRHGRRCARRQRIQSRQRATRRGRRRWSALHTRRSAAP